MAIMELKGKCDLAPPPQKKKNPNIPVVILKNTLKCYF